jgi:hypothetical protein
MSDPGKPRHLLHHQTVHSSKALLVGDIVGWIGAASLIAAYLLISFCGVSADTFLYQILNVVGAVGLLVLAFARKAYPSAATNIVWLLIGALAILGLIGLF